MGDRDLMDLLLETAKALHASGELQIFEGEMIVLVPYMKFKPDGSVVRTNSVRLMHGRSKCRHRK